jgi:hypothetical protein
LAAKGWGRQENEALAGHLIAEPATADNALRLAHEWLVTEPPQVYELRAGRRIGVSMVRQIEQRVHQLRLIDDHAGGLDTYDRMTDELHVTLGLLRNAGAPKPPATGHRLLAALGELCQIVGWTVSDAGHHDQAAASTSPGYAPLMRPATGPAPRATSPVSPTSSPTPATLTRPR